MIVSEIVTLLIYAVSMFFLQEYFGTSLYLRPYFSMQRLTLSHNRRPKLRDVRQVCVEGCSDCGDQRSASVDHQSHQE